MNPRLPHTRATVTLAQRDPDEPTPCHGNSHPYDVLIDLSAGREYHAAEQEARALCGTCPIRARCFTDNREEPWVRALLDVKVAPTLRDTCGSPRGANAHYRHGETACAECRRFEADRSRKRKADAALAKNVQTLADIPEVVRVMHAKFVSLTAKGEEIPTQIREGERTYQALRHKVRKIKAEQAEVAA